MAKNNQIDFLTVVRQSSVKQSKTLRLLNVASIVFLILYCLIVLSIVSYWIISRQEYQHLENQISLKKKEVEKQQDLESLQYLLKQRLSILTGIFSPGKKSNLEVFNFVQAKANAGVDLKKIEIFDKDVTVNGSATDTGVLGEFFNNLSVEEVNEFFSKIVINSLAKQIDGSYSFQIVLHINEKS